MNKTRVTVMGLGRSQSQTSGMIPTSFEDASDRASWMGSVNEWCDKVVASAEEVDNKLKLIAAGLDLALFRSLQARLK